jgi:hypothetical protein
MPNVTEGKHSSGFILSEAQGKRSRDNVTILSGQVLKAGAVLGSITTGSSATSAANAGNTGNGAMGAVTVSTGAKPGVYRLNISAAATDAGTFEVEDPDGNPVGTGTVGAAFSHGGLAFTLADGSMDFAVGDGFTITVAAGSGKFKEHNAAGTVGEQAAAAILLDNVDATDGDTPAAIIARDAEVNANELVWFSGATTEQKNAAIAALATKGIIVRS